MKILKYFTLFLILFCFTLGCKKDQFSQDTSFANAAASAGNVAVMFDITHDNSGLVTITPSANGATKYTVTFGDGTTNTANVAAGKSVQHTYSEGTYQVKLVAYDLKGGTTTITQQLVVSFRTPQNLAVKLTLANLTASVSATADYATLFKMSFGDSTATNPVQSSFALSGVTVNHTYASAGTYVVKITALSGGSETTSKLDTIVVSTPLNLPVTFENPNVKYILSDFGGEASSVVVDPANSSNHVGKSIKTTGAQTWAGVTIGSGAGFATPIPISTSNEKMTLQVYSPAIGLDIKLKLDNHANPNNGLSFETDVLTTKQNHWETQTFDFSKNAAGTPAFKASNT
ncbi:MAG: PKD domain-containing protein, partial [Sphingobacteriales bacterium]